jgi:oligoendopeptidase F
VRSINTDFVPADLDASTWEAIEPFFVRLMERSIHCGNCLRKLLLDRSELAATIDEKRANLYIEKTRRTDDADVKQAYLHFVENVEPKIRQATFDLAKRIIENEHVGSLDEREFGVLLRAMRAEVELFRAENIPLQTRLTTLDAEYDEISGAMTVDFDGAERTMPQMARYLEETDRDVRERAWRGMSERRIADADRIDELFDRMIELRHTVARNAGFENYRDFQHRNLMRFDYTPADCETFQKSVEQVCVPFLKRLHEERRDRLGVDRLRPWDVKVDPLGRTPLRPFESETELVEGSSTAFHSMDEDLGSLFDSMREGDCLDLASRKGKAPGGYQYQRQRSGRPFIFMNAAGMHRDLQTMIHEAGHAFHSLLSVHHGLVEYRESPIEFAEVASMGMEMLAMPRLDTFYEAGDADRARRDHLEDVVSMLPWIAQIDAFQHWLYTHPDHSRQERTGAWLELQGRFGGIVDWSGLESFQSKLWQRQGHLFGVPFYYIEYGIAQLGALQLWQRSLIDEASALDGYKAALALGGSRPLPELFEAAGLRFDFGPEMMGSLVEGVTATLETLPA